MNMRRQLVTMAIAMALQLAAQGQTRNIRGTVTNDKGKPLQIALVALLKADDSAIIVKGRANVSGAYNIDYSYNGNVLLKAEATGYNYEIKALSAEKPVSEINFLLVAEKGLKAVVISGAKPIIEEKIDRTVFNVENSITATSGDA